MPGRRALFPILFLAKKTGQVTADHGDHHCKRENRTQRCDPDRDPHEKEEAQQQMSVSSHSQPARMRHIFRRKRKLGDRWMAKWRDAEGQHQAVLGRAWTRRGSPPRAI